LGQVKRELDHLVLDTLDKTMRDIGVAADERQRLGHTYLETAERLGLRA
jgi:hypothetical protein